MRKSIVDRDIPPAFQNRQLNEITADDLHALCNKVKARGAPATAVHIRDVVKQEIVTGLLVGLAVAPTIAYYGSMDPTALWQAGGATALFIAGFGAAATPATSSDGSASR